MSIKQQRIAFLGGAFDPPHPGHEMLARRVLAAGLSDLVLWVPSWAPPHKAAGRMTDFAHRLEMVRLVTEKISGCGVSDIEARRKFDPSYSYKILGALQEEYPACKIQLLIGQDSLEQLHTWYNARALVAEYEILAFPRKTASGCDNQVILPEDFWSAELADKLKKSLIPGDFVEISSTDLRNELAKNKSACHIINEDVLNYIEKHGLYR